MTQKYLRGVYVVLKYWKIAIAVFCALSFLAGFLFVSLFSSFFPDEDQALIIGQVRLRPNETQAKLKQIGREVSAWILENYPETNPGRRSRLCLDGTLF